MKPLLNPLVRHVSRVLGSEIAPVPWAGESGLPPYLQERYRFYQARLLGTPCLFLLDESRGEQPATIVRKHVEQARARSSLPAVYVRQGVTAYHRRRLIEQGVPFVVPGNQMYLPTLGLDLREHFQRVQADRPRFRPSTQAVLIDSLLENHDQLGVSEVAPRLGYSAMTISRAFDELEAAGLAESRPNGRARRLRLTGPRSEVWRKAQPYLRDPAQSRHWVELSSEAELPGPHAGLTALSQRSMLAAPPYLALAVSREDWRSLHQRNVVSEAREGEPGALNLEVWSYPPRLFATQGTVDRLSLYLSLRGTEDERTAAALEQMMEEVPW